MLLQDSSLLDGLSNMLDDSTSEEYLGFPIRLQNTMDTRQGALVFFDVKILSKILTGDAFCSECAMSKLVSIPAAGSISVVFFFWGGGKFRHFYPGFWGYLQVTIGERTISRAPNRPCCCFLRQLEGWEKNETHRAMGRFL